MRFLIVMVREFLACCWHTTNFPWYSCCDSPWPIAGTPPALRKFYCPLLLPAGIAHNYFLTTVWSAWRESTLLIANLAIMLETPAYVHCSNLQNQHIASFMTLRTRYFSRPSRFFSWNATKLYFLFLKIDIVFPKISFNILVNKINKSMRWTVCM